MRLEIRSLSVYAIATVPALIAILIYTWIAGAQAAEPINGVSTSTPFINRMHVSYMGMLNGPSLSEPLTGLQPNSTGDLDSPITIDHFLMSSFNVTEGSNGWKVGPGIYIEQRPAREKAVLAHEAFLSASTCILCEGNFRMRSSLSALIPLDQDRSALARDFGAMENLRGDFVIPNSRFSVGVTARLRAFSHSRASNSDYRLKAYLSPEVSYVLSSHTSLSAAYELTGKNKARGQTLTQWNNGGTDLTIGISHQIFSQLTVNPYVMLQPGDKITAASTSLGLMIQATLL